MTPCPKGCNCGRCRNSRQRFAEVMAQRAAVQAELVRAVEHWRWCWDCGARTQDCDRANGKPCCPDCKHRNPTEARINFLVPDPAPTTTP